MSRSSVPGAVEFATEAAWGETSSTFGSRLQILGQVDTSGLTRQLIDSERTVQYLQGGTIPIQGVFGGEFTMDFWLAGHGTAATGAVTAQAHELMLGYALGVCEDVGDGMTITGGTAAIPTVSAASGINAGALLSIGAIQDGDGNGQVVPVGTHAGSALNLLFAIDAAPANAQVVYSGTNIYPASAASGATVQPMRFRLLTANQQYACHGCYPISVRITGLGNGEMPRASITWGVSWWEPVSATFPSAVAVSTFNPAPTSGGSFVAETVATTTRTKYTIRAFELSIDLGVIPTPGPGGVDAAQTIVGALRGPQNVTFSFTVDSDAATATPTWAAKIGTLMHVMYSWCGAAAGRRGGIYFPSACVTGATPVQFNDGGVNRERVTMSAYTGATTSSELTLSAYRIYQG
jgi:hypothetical protein